MAHDGQDLSNVAPVLLDNLLTLTEAAVAPVDAIVSMARDRLRTKLSVDGRVSSTLVEQNQTAAHGLAWLATYAEALRQMQKWANELSTEYIFFDFDDILEEIGLG